MVDRDDSVAEMKKILGKTLTFTMPDPAPQVPDGCLPFLVNDADANYLQMALVPGGNPLVWDGKQWVLASIAQIEFAVACEKQKRKKKKRI